MTLRLLEIVLGIDNVIFIAILAAKLPAAQQGRARVLGLGAAMLVRVGLLFAIASIMRLTEDMADDVAVMVTAIVISVAVMMLSASVVASFVEQHPTVKMLALSFLLLIGMSLVAEGVGQHISKGYICFAMSFSGVRRNTRPAPTRAATRAPATSTGALSVAELDTGWRDRSRCAQLEDTKIPVCSSMRSPLTRSIRRTHSRAVPGRTCAGSRDSINNCVASDWGSWALPMISNSVSR